MANYVESFAAKMDWGKPFQRTGKLPLDRSSMFSSYADAVLYASGVADSDSRKLAASSYVGQIITVYENGVVTVYKIEENRSLTEVGRATEGDGKSIVLSDGILSLFDFDKATEGQQLRIKNKGTTEKPEFVLEWFTPSTETVDGLQAAVGALQQSTATMNSDINGLKDVVGHAADAETGAVASGLFKDIADLAAAKADAADVYTKKEIDGKLTGALHYRGGKETYQALLDSVTDGSYVPEVGDVWNITTAGGADSAGVEILAGDNVIYNGTGWDVSTGTVDLSAYYTAAQVEERVNELDRAFSKVLSNAAEELGKKVDKAEGQRLMTDAEGARLAEVSKVEASEVNGNIKLEGQETTVYSLPTASAAELGGVKSSSAKDAVAVGTDGVMSLNTVSGSKVDGAVAEASKVTHGLKVGDKTFDGSADVELLAGDIPLPSSVIHNTDIASEVSTGVVKSSAAQDGVAVATDGTMSVNDISASKVKGVVSEAAKVSHKLTAGEKTFDGSAEMEITAEDLGAMKVADMGTYVQKTDIATKDEVGVVKSSTAQDAISVDSDGSMHVNTISGARVKGAVDDATNAARLGNIASGDILVEGGAGQVKSAAAADKLASARTVSINGDASGSFSFDGSKDVKLEIALKTVGAAGTYTKVTTDKEGRVIAGETLAASDIPSLEMSKISNAGALATKDEVARTDLDSTLVAELDGLGTKAHTHDNKAVLDGISASKVSTWDETAGKIDSKADAATTLEGYGITDAYTKAQVDGMVAGAFHFMGTYASMAELVAAVEAGTITPLAGHVYNITAAGGTDMHGHAIHAGDNVAYVSGETSGWDVLGGTMDMSAYSTTEIINAKLAEKAEKTTVNGINDRVGVLESKVGDDTQGLVKTVADHTSRLSTDEQNIANLQTAVGDDKSGLVKAVADHTSAIQTLNGDASTEGSVRKIVADAAAEINEDVADITKDGGAIDSKVSAHNAAADAHADLFAAKQNKAIQAAVTFEVADFVANADGPSAYKVSKAVAGLDASKNYAPSISPAIASCLVIAAAQFFPVAEVNGGYLTLYCNKIPTAAIIVNGTFTEIH